MRRERRHASKRWVRLRCVGMLTVGVLATVSPEVQAEGLFYDLTPLAEKSPAVRKGLELLNASSTEIQSRGAELKEVLKELAAFRAVAEDELDRASSTWLRGSLLRHNRNIEESRVEFEILAKGKGSLRDLGYVELYDSMQSSKSYGSNIERLLEIGPWVPQYASYYKRAILFLLQEKRYSKAAERVLNILDRALSPALRQGLEKRLIDLWSQLGQSDKAVALLMRTWWKSKRETTRKKAQKVLRSLKSRPSYYAQVARVAFRANRGSVRGARKALAKMKGIGTHQRRMHRWALSVLNRFRSDLRPLTLRKLERMRRHIPKKALPYFLFGQALVLKSDRQAVEAATKLREIAKMFPNHHLAPEAALEAGRLLSDHGDKAEGMGAFQRAIEMAPRGEFHREGLWRVGFTAFLAGEYKRAASMMADIATRYGGELEALGILWAEKAGYWHARSVELSGDTRQSALLYRKLMAEFPVSWYGVWA